MTSFYVIALLRIDDLTCTCTNCLSRHLIYRSSDLYHHVLYREYPDLLPDRARVESVRALRGRKRDLSRNFCQTPK